MPDKNINRSWFRIHKNGMIACVMEFKAWGRFIAGAARDGETGVASDYASFDQARVEADAEARADSHTCTAECGSWSN